MQSVYQFNSSIPGILGDRERKKYEKISEGTKMNIKEYYRDQKKTVEFVQEQKTL